MVSNFWNEGGIVWLVAWFCFFHHWSGGHEYDMIRKVFFLQLQEGSDSRGKNEWKSHSVLFSLTNCIYSRHSPKIWGKSLIPTCRENNGKEAEKIVTGSAWLSLITFYFGCKILPINTIFSLMHTENNY